MPRNPNHGKGRASVSIDLFVCAFWLGVLAFRLWLVERKLVDELQFRRRYLSRIINYYCWLALAFQLQLKPANWVVVAAFPILLVTSVWDFRFYRRYPGRTYWQKNRRWMLLERLTLHPPLLILGLYLILTNARQYVTDVGFQPIWAGILLLFLPFILLDERWTHRYNWPQAPIVTTLLISATAIMALTQVSLWGVPLP